MQNKTTQHKLRTLYAVKRSIIRLLKTENMIKDYIIINDDNKKDWEKKYDYVASVPNVQHNVWS